MPKRLIILLIIYIMPIVAKDSFSLELSKTKAYLNEPLLATFTLTYPKDEKPRFIKFEDLKSRGFLIKKIKESKEQVKGLEIVKYFYKVVPQTTGDIVFKIQSIKIARLEPKTSMIIWKKLESKEQNIEVKAIPSEVFISGDLTLSVSSKKRESNILDLTIKLEGKANFGDIKPFKLDVKDATIYYAKPKIKYSVNKDINGTFSQKITILSNKDVTIPAVNFSYFNANTQMIELLQSKATKLEVKNRVDLKTKLIWLFLGVVLGLILALLLYLIKFKKVKSHLPLIAQIKLCTTKKCLYKTLLPYIKEYDLDYIISALEENIYEGKDIKIYKKDILKIIEAR